VNGEPCEVADGSTIVDVLSVVRAGGPARGVAVAVNDEVIPRGEWERSRLTDDDRIEILTAIGGG